ncbi:LysR family transcriptional regulator [Paenibacillus guangzhouensis]|uniref:LysR family transcriptional regulator n=1 Tax=Paenibacillus guangzhouensis TaxID=1473112 RepID=UPI001266942A|nr:LysR family transcriptional regulator [Paenibacillus guangzhouensis]
MNLHALRIFHTVAEVGSVTRAADRLCISQPAVTAQIRKLERELEVELLSPQGRGITLTEVGRMLADRASQLFAMEEDIELQVTSYRHGRRGVLRVAATYLPANFLLPHLIASYKQEYLDVDIRISTVNSRDAIAMLREYEVDIAFIGGEQLDDPALHREDWFEDACWFVVPQGHPMAGAEVSFAQMMREPFVMREQGSGMRERLLTYCQMYHVTPPTIAVEMNGSQESIRAVMAGCGAMFVSSLEVREEIERGRLAQVKVPEIEAGNPISIYTRANEASPVTARNLISRLKNENVLAKFKYGVLW